MNDWVKKTFQSIALLLFAGGVISCNSEKESYGNIYRFPLLASCKDFAEKKLGSFAQKSSYFSFRLVEFEEALQSHPDIIGYIELRDPHLNTDKLAPIAAAVTVNCYPRSSTVVDKDEGFQENMFYFFDLLNKRGIGQTYIVNSEESLELHFRLVDDLGSDSLDNNGSGD